MNEQMDPNQTTPPSAAAGGGGAPPTQAGPLPARPDYNSVRVPILVSAIFNILLALMWFGTCFLFFLGIPVLVLAVFEIIMFARLGDPAQAKGAAGRAKLFGILEICTILVGNVASLVCGIIVLVNAERA